MLSFHSFLADAIRRFIDLRRLSGTDYHSQALLLGAFDRFVVRAGGGGRTAGDPPARRGLSTEPLGVGPAHPGLTACAWSGSYASIWQHAIRACLCPSRYVHYPFPGGAHPLPLHSPGGPGAAGGRRRCAARPAHCGSHTLRTVLGTALQHGPAHWRDIGL